MKGIVVEINQRDAVILSEDGIFTKVKNKQYLVGQKIDTGHSVRIRIKWAAGAVSAAAVLMISTAGAAAYYTPTDYISLDVNPSIEYTINRFDRILDTKAVNDDGEALLADLDFENMKLQDAMKKTLDLLIEEGYLSSGQDSGVVITTSNEKRDDAEKLANNLKTEMQDYLGSHKGITAEVKAEAIKPEKLEAAKELGVSPGKLNLVEKLQKSTTGAIDLDEWLDKPVKEINQEIKKNHRNNWTEKEALVNQNIPSDLKDHNNRRNTQVKENQRWHQLKENKAEPNLTSNGAVNPEPWKSWNQYDNDQDSDENESRYQWITPGGIETSGNPSENQSDGGNRWDRNNGRFNDDKKEHNKPDWNQDRFEDWNQDQSDDSNQE